MWKKCNGFSLLETLLALSVLSIVIGAAVPVLYRIYHERFTLQQQREALELLANKLSDENSFEDGTVTGETGEFRWESREGAPCIAFTGKNKRIYSECGVTKRWIQSQTALP
ncbi:type II secretion system protein [Fictibacillus fluitans]|uniref:Type II secretion system protein n=1 Tax=Fictibacillus fluitans TaxID=3058422 RepID=A0ABT8HWZ3_9BACL|nr:type II secretion system protein [Fictibacillus sp. NE201]MDN4525303.1 type II secretion system protein [Fictibacillus sp. NE201]